jgi:nitrite reductase/ring-hydroxylating ferredoxin subunit
MTDSFIEVARASELPVGRIRAVKVEDRTIALCHSAKGFFALDNVCPHRGGPLAEGDLIGGEIVCPWHLWGFDLASGRCPGNDEFAVATHDVRVDGDRILIRVTERETASVAP